VARAEDFFICASTAFCNSGSVDFDDLEPFLDHALVLQLGGDQVGGHGAGAVHAPYADGGQRHQQAQHQGKDERETTTDGHLLHLEPLAVE
jgi:hypothetical protein